MVYRTVYDATREFARVWFPAVGLMVSGFCALLWAYRNQIFTGAEPAVVAGRKRILVYFLAGSILFTVGSTVAIVQEYRDGPELLQGGRATVVEGVVEEFRPMRTGHDTERFTVRGVRFSYSPNVRGLFFNQAGGPVREGLHVRIHYAVRPCSGGCADILKLEIAE